jgi:hypothetical protein
MGSAMSTKEVVTCLITQMGNHRVPFLHLTTDNGYTIFFRPTYHRRSIRLAATVENKEKRLVYEGFIDCETPLDKSGHYQRYRQFVLFVLGGPVGTRFEQVGA